MNEFSTQHRAASALLAMAAILTTTILRTTSPANAADSPPIVVTPAATLCERAGVTGAGTVVAFDRDEATRSFRRLVGIYPNHPDDWGKTGGTGASVSADGGRVWTAASDDWPAPGMIDLWLDRLADGELLAIGIRSLPQREAVQAGKPSGGQYRVGRSSDQGRTWKFADCQIECPESIGVVARPLPRILERADGSLAMPGYAWSTTGHRAVLLLSHDRGRRWNVSATIATAAALRATGATVSTPWLETAVSPASDGSWLAVVRTGSSARSGLVGVRSTDAGATWGTPEPLRAGPAARIVPGKLPGLCLLENGTLVLLTAHTKNHCRLYLSADGVGRQWSDGYVVTSQSGGNTSMTPIGPDQLLVVTPANGRINAWRATIGDRRGTAPDASLRADSLQSAAAIPAPSGLVFDGRKGILRWTPHAADANVSHYRVTPILVRAAAEQSETDIYPYASVSTPDATPSLELGRKLLFGGVYRFEVIAVDRQGRSSSAAVSGEQTFGKSSVEAD